MEMVTGSGIDAGITGMVVSGTGDVMLGSRLDCVEDTVSLRAFFLVLVRMGSSDVVESSSINL